MHIYLFVFDYSKISNLKVPKFIEKIFNFNSLLIICRLCPKYEQSFTKLSSAF